MRTQGYDPFWIQDKEVFKAISFTKRMLSEGKLTFEECVARAAKHYKVAPDAVVTGIAKRALAAERMAPVPEEKK
jgi:hypothetical protein